MNSADTAERKGRHETPEPFWDGGRSPFITHHDSAHQTMGLPIALPGKPSAAFLMVTHLDDKWLFLPSLPIPDYIYQNLYSSEPMVTD